MGGKRAKAEGLKLKAKVVWLKLKWESLRVRGPLTLKQLGALWGREGIGVGPRGQLWGPFGGAGALDA